jgi:D-threo-aldose 1-dehydrogenase
MSMIDPTSRHPLGSTDLMIGSLGLGVAPLGNLYAPVSDDDAQGTLAAAERLGISWFDVAPYYGFGMAEARLGRFLQHSSGPRHVISTKVGRVLYATDSPPGHPEFVAPCSNRPVFDYSRAGIERSFSDSLRRLGLDRVEILLLHDIDRLSHPHDHRSLVQQLLNEALPTLQGLKAKGAVKAIGLGINEWDVGYEILTSAHVDCVLLAGRYTLLDSTAFTSGFLDACARKGVAVLAGGVFNSGFLAGGSRYDYRVADSRRVAARQALLEICGRYSVALPAVALRFTSAHPAITSVVVGARSASEVAEICQWSQAEIPAQLWSDLRHANLIPTQAPMSSN